MEGRTLAVSRHDSWRNIPVTLIDPDECNPPVSSATPVSADENSQRRLAGGLVAGTLRHTDSLPYDCAFRGHSVIYKDPGTPRVAKLSTKFRTFTGEPADADNFLTRAGF